MSEAIKLFGNWKVGSWAGVNLELYNDSDPPHTKLILSVRYECQCYEVHQAPEFVLRHKHLIDLGVIARHVIEYGELPKEMLKREIYKEYG